MRPFRSLSARLTVQFALLFAAAMLVVSAALSTLIAGSASREVESQLQSSGAVYDRLWQQRAHELQNAAQLLARDFGFRAAAATGDEATMQSALGNAAARLKVRTAFIVTADGHVSAIDPSIGKQQGAALWGPLDEGKLTGVSVLAGRPRQLVAAPIMAPTLIGWVVFAADLDEREMRSLERLSAIPLHAAVLANSNGRWSDAAGRLASGEHVQVRVRGEDELARLATSFNEMVGKIAEREQRITQLAFNDVLTGLPNRTMFQQQLEHLFRASEGNGSLFALHCLDLDQFKVINDTLGHPAGDALLVEAGRRVEDAARGHFVARLGGDEFVVLQTVGDDRDAIDRLARDVLAAITQPIIIDGNEFAPSTSIGIAIAPQDGGNGGSLLRSADLALYRAKEAGRGTYAFFEES